MISIYLGKAYKEETLKGLLEGIEKLSQLYNLDLEYTTDPKDFQEVYINMENRFYIEDLWQNRDSPYLNIFVGIEDIYGYYKGELTSVEDWFSNQFG